MAALESSTPVTPQYLLQGAAYALEQCGLLLHQANLLFQSGHNSTAVALAAFAREELGRYRILLTFRDEVLAGRVVTIKVIKDKTKNHVQKQQRGMLSIRLSGDDSPEITPLLEAKASAMPGSQEWIKVDEVLGRVQRKKWRCTPSERHERRMVALYVKPVDSGWSRPRIAVSKDDAERFIIDAVNDYSIQYHYRYITSESSNLQYFDELLYSELAA